MIVRDHMSSNPFIVNVTDSIGLVLANLLEADVRHLPVVDNGLLVGIVSDRDLRRSLDTSPGPGRNGVQDPFERPVSELMSSDVISVNPETELVEVIDLMIEHKIGALPVVGADSLKLLGIISYIDVLRAARAQLG